MAIVLDAGALIAVERSSHEVLARLERARRDGTPIKTTTGVVAQVWRGGSRQARLGLVLRGVAEAVLDPDAARRIGALLGVAATSDVVDGSIIDIAVDGDEILTSEPSDLRSLANAAGKRLLITPVGG